jgi:hypothetical protein
VTPGTTLYYVMKLSSAEATIRGPSSTVGDRDCVWPSGGSSHSTDESFVSSSGLATASIFLEVCIWKSVMRVFDSLLASCQIKLKPLFLHSNVCTERWFDLRDPDGETGTEI